MRASRDALPSFRSRLSATLLFLAALVADLGQAPRAAAETIDVGCDKYTLAGAINLANRNGEEDLIWLSPPCLYQLQAPLVIEADGGNPVRIYGQGATISGEVANVPLIVNAGAVVDLHDVTVTKGTTTGSGGAIRNLGTLTLTDSTVSDSVAANTGGGIHNSGTLRLIGSTVSGNASTVSGGGIDNAAQARLTLIDSTVTGNTSTYGAGIRNRHRAFLFNSTLSRNTGFVGGGLLNEPLATAILGNVTISDNEISGSDGGGGIRNEGALALDNSILANTDLGGRDCFNSGTITPSGGNLVEDGSCALAGALSGDPMLLDESVRSALTGGKPSFIPLLPGSPAIDAGSNSSCPGADQGGYARPRDGDRNGTNVCDLGAYESACGLLGIELFFVLPLARGLARLRRRLG